MSSAHLILTVLLAAPAQPTEQRQESAGFVRERQTPDGGFAGSRAPGTSATSSLRATAAALRALRYFASEPQDKTACQRFTRACRDDRTGGYADRPRGEPTVLATAAGIMAAVEFKELPDARAIAYLGEHASTSEEIRMAAAALEGTGRLPPQADEWRRRLAFLRNADGTFGHGPMAARETAGGVVTWLRLGGRIDHADAVLRALRDGQRPDGGFGDAAGPSDLESTYRVMRAFVMLKAAPRDPARVRQFVEQCRNSDGGYGLRRGPQSEVTATYFAAAVLHWLDER